MRQTANGKVLSTQGQGKFEQVAKVKSAGGFLSKLGKLIWVAT